jgi:hypothetical protein
VKTYPRWQRWAVVLGFVLVLGIGGAIERLPL